MKSKIALRYQKETIKDKIETKGYEIWTPWFSIPDIFLCVEYGHDVKMSLFFRCFRKLRSLDLCETAPDEAFREKYDL